jgi:3-oxoacyl-[acyl-carrier protein] reductase
VHQRFFLKAKMFEAMAARMQDVPGVVATVRQAYPGTTGGHAMNLRFDDKVVAVSGAGHGFGQSIAESFAMLGTRVFGCGPVAASPVGTTMAVVDLTDRAAGAAWIAGVEQAAGPPVDIVVNDAGGVAGQVFHPIDEISYEDWDRIIAINLGADFVLSRAAAPGMKRAGHGRIVNISSGAGLKASPTGIQAYATAKHAMVGLTRRLSHELGPYGITVNSVAPGLITSNPASLAQWKATGRKNRPRCCRRPRCGAWAPRRTAPTPSYSSRARLAISSLDRLCRWTPGGSSALLPSGEALRYEKVMEPAWTVTPPMGRASFESVLRHWDEEPQDALSVELLGQPTLYGIWRANYAANEHDFDVDIVSFGWASKYNIGHRGSRN